MGWAAFAGRCQRPSPTVQIPAAGSLLGGFFVALARHRITPSGLSGLTGPAPPNGPPRRSGLFWRYGYEMASGQSRRVRLQFPNNPWRPRGSSERHKRWHHRQRLVFTQVSVIYLRRLLILGSSTEEAGQQARDIPLILCLQLWHMSNPSPTFSPTSTDRAEVCYLPPSLPLTGDGYGPLTGDGYRTFQIYNSSRGRARHFQFPFREYFIDIDCTVDDYLLPKLFREVSLQVTSKFHILSHPLACFGHGSIPKIFSWRSPPQKKNKTKREKNDKKEKKKTKPRNLVLETSQRQSSGVPLES